MDEVLIELKRTWFGPNSVRYRDEANGARIRHRVPVEIAVQAPSDARIFDQNGKFLGTREDWSQDAEASSVRTKDARTAVNAARKKATDATASVQAAKAAHAKETDAEKKKVAAEAVKTAEADEATAKKELDEALKTLEALEKKD